MSNPFHRAYAFEKLYGLERLRVTLEKAEAAYQSHQPETIDFCKSALECICKAILQEKGDTQHTGIQDIPKLIKATLRALGHPNERIGGGISNLASGIAEMRNSHTIAGHGIEESVPFLSETECEIVVKTFTHTVDVLLTLLEAQKVDIASTKMSFSAAEASLNLEAVNEEIDGNVEVSYSAEDGVFFLNGKELRPSEVLYHFDRPGYHQRVKRAIEAKQDQLEEQCRELLSEALYDRFEGFHPGHYGVEELEIDIQPFEVGGDRIAITGTVFAVARLGSSREEDSMTADYSSAFSASFIFPDDDEPDVIELESLELAVVDCVRPDDIECYGS